MKAQSGRAVQALSKKALSIEDDAPRTGLSTAKRPATSEKLEEAVEASAPPEVPAPETAGSPAPASPEAAGREDGLKPGTKK
jgi:hypothetical protein